MTSSELATIARYSQDSANRDTATLIKMGRLLKVETGGRSTNCELAL